MRKILLSPPHLAGNEMTYLQQVLDSGWIAPIGEMLATFEQQVCAFTGAKYALATSSGTAAIHIGLRLLGVGEGDWVICPSLTFIATANPILYLHAQPVFVDADEQGNISPCFLEKALAYCTKTGKRVRAIIVVHLYGQSAQLHELMLVAMRYNVPILEDAAEAMGSLYAGKAAGIWGQVGVLSFNGNKMITTSGGGMLLLPTAEAYEKAKFWATQAKDAAPHYQHSEIGYNYRLSNVLAGIGVAQMEVLPARIASRRAIFAYYWEALTAERVGGEASFLTEMPETYSNRWLTVVLFRDKKTREKVRIALQNAGIEARPVWKPLHLQPVFEGVPYFGSRVGEELFERGLCLPSGSAMTEDDLAYCVAHLKASLL